MATVVMPQAINQSAIRSRSSVNVVHTRTGSSCRSGGTATKSRGPRCRYQPRLAATLVGLPGTGLSVFASAPFADSSSCLFACVRSTHCSPLCSRQRPSLVNEGILLNGINLRDSSGCNHWITHGTWDHARTRAFTTAPLIQRPTSAACSSSSLPRRTTHCKFLHRITPPRGHSARTGRAYHLPASIVGLLDFIVGESPKVTRNHLAGQMEEIQPALSARTCPRNRVR